MSDNDDSHDEHDPIPVKAANIIQFNRERHAIGRRAIEQGTRRATLATQLGISEGQVSRIKRFAAEYTDEELDALCELRRPSGIPLNFGHVLYLLQIPGRAARRAMEIEAAENDWTPPDLSRHIRERFPTGRRGRGRRMHRPPNLVDGFGRMVTEISRGKQRIAMMREIINEGGQDLEQLSADMLESARQELEDLRREASSFVRLMGRLGV